MDCAQIFSLYYDCAPEVIKTLELSRGDDDFRKVYIVTDGTTKLVIKHTSNAFTDGERIIGWAALIEEYNRLDVYCPRIVCNRGGTLYFRYTIDGRDYYVYAEEFARFAIAEDVGERNYLLPSGLPAFNDDSMLALGRVAAARFDMMSWPSAYCLLEPFCPPDTTDEQTECAEKFFSFIDQNLPEHRAASNELKALFYDTKQQLAAVYSTLPVSCFQADLNNSNILLDDERRFKGLIDFNLSGREPILNYTVREALWQSNYFGENEDGYDSIEGYLEQEAPRMKQFLHNLEMIGRAYSFTLQEREVFPILLRYLYSPWWGDISHIKAIHENTKKVEAYLSFLKIRMTRNDILLP